VTFFFFSFFFQYKLLVLMKIVNSIIHVDIVLCIHFEGLDHLKISAFSV
jgi:hypothetical protein